jgi:hypothetical protein
MRTHAARSGSKSTKLGTPIASPQRLRGSALLELCKDQHPVEFALALEAAPQANWSVPSSLWGCHGSTGYKEVEFALRRL